MTYQYYYKVNSCHAINNSDCNCICWHDDGTGPYSDAVANVEDTDFEWREKPAVNISIDMYDVLYIYIRHTSEGRLIRVVYSADAKEFEDDPDWLNVGTISPRSFIESLLQYNEIIFAACFPKERFNDG